MNKQNEASATIELSWSAASVVKTTVTVVTTLAAIKVIEEIATPQIKKLSKLLEEKRG